MCPFDKRKIELTDKNKESFPINHTILLLF